MKKKYLKNIYSFENVYNSPLPPPPPPQHTHCLQTKKQQDKEESFRNHHSHSVLQWLKHGGNLFSQDQENQGDCKVCPSGYYCTSNSTLYSDKICPSGYYCPNGTQHDLQYPCPSGTFNNLTGREYCYTRYTGFISVHPSVTVFVNVDPVCSWHHVVHPPTKDCFFERPLL